MPYSLDNDDDDEQQNEQPQSNPPQGGSSSLGAQNPPSSNVGANGGSTRAFEANGGLDSSVLGHRSSSIGRESTTTSYGGDSLFRSKVRRRGFGLDDDDEDGNDYEEEEDNMARRGIGPSSRRTDASSKRSTYSTRSTYGGSSTRATATGKQKQLFSMDDDDDEDGEEESDVRMREGRDGGRMGDEDGSEALDLVDIEFENDNDIKRLSRAWVKERGTQEIMRWEGDVVEDCLHKLTQQTKMLEVLKTDSSTTDEEHFKLMLVQTEMERVKFLIRAYVRCRIHKVEKYAQYILGNIQVQAMLSELELGHAKKYNRLLQTHFGDSVLNALPEWLRKMDDVANNGLSMVRKPDKNAVVLVHCLRDENELVLSDGTRVPLTEGSTHLVRYSLVERYIQLGSMEVL